MKSTSVTPSLFVGDMPWMLSDCYRAETTGEAIQLIRAGLKRRTPTRTLGPRRGRAPIVHRRPSARAADPSLSHVRPVRRPPVRLPLLPRRRHPPPTQPRRITHLVPPCGVVNPTDLGCHARVVRARRPTLVLPRLPRVVSNDGRVRTGREQNPTRCSNCGGKARSRVAVSSSSATKVTGSACTSAVQRATVAADPHGGARRCAGSCCGQVGGWLGCLAQHV
jgi:hypothetical protein